MTIIEYSKAQIGKVWSGADHVWLETQILKLEHLAQELAKYQRQFACGDQEHQEETRAAGAMHEKQFE